MTDQALPLYSISKLVSVSNNLLPTELRKLGLVSDVQIPVLHHTILGEVKGNGVVLQVPLL